jgi:hypothetical protein
VCERERERERKRERECEYEGEREREGERGRESVLAVMGCEFRALCLLGNCFT